MNKYQKLAIRTAKKIDQKSDLIHAGLGLAGEAGEFVDAVKKYAIYNKPLDKANLIEELGDLLWYIALACDTLGIDMDEVAKQNIDKLLLRYPDKYTDELASRRLDKPCVCQHIHLCELHDRCVKNG